MKAIFTLVCTFVLISQISLLAHPGHPHPEWDEVDEFAAENFKTSVVHHLTSPDHLFSMLSVLVMISFPFALVIMVRKFMPRQSHVAPAMVKIKVASKD